MKLVVSILIISILINCCLSININVGGGGESATESPSSYTTFVPYQDKNCGEVSGIGFGILKGEFEQPSIYYPYNNQVALCANITQSGSIYKVVFSGNNDCYYGEYLSTETYRFGVCTYSQQLQTYYKIVSNFQPPTDTLLMSEYTKSGSFGNTCSVYQKSFYNFITNGTVLSNIQNPDGPVYKKQVYYCSDSVPFTFSCDLNSDKCSTDEIVGCNEAELRTRCSN